MATGLAWTVAVALGLLIGGFAFHFPGSYGEPSISVAAGIFGLLLGAVNGVIVGGLAALALRLGRSGAMRLIGAMALIVGATHALNDGSSTQLPFVVVQAVAGIVAAGTFAWRFDERRPVVLAVIGGAWAIGILIAGWSGDRIGLPLTETPIGWSQDHAWDGLVTGVVWGTATALVGVPSAVRRWRPSPQPAVSPA